MFEYEYISAHPLRKIVKEAINTPHILGSIGIPYEKFNAILEFEFIQTRYFHYSSEF